MTIKSIGEIQKSKTRYIHHEKKLIQLCWALEEHSKISKGFLRFLSGLVRFVGKKRSNFISLKSFRSSTCKRD